MKGVSGNTGQLRADTTFQKICSDVHDLTHDPAFADKKTKADEILNTAWPTDSEHVGCDSIVALGKTLGGTDAPCVQWQQMLASKTATEQTESAGSSLLDLRVQEQKVGPKRRINATFKLIRQERKNLQKQIATVKEEMVAILFDGQKGVNPEPRPESQLNQQELADLTALRKHRENLGSKYEGLGKLGRALSALRTEKWHDRLSGAAQMPITLWSQPGVYWLGFAPGIGFSERNPETNRRQWRFAFQPSGDLCSMVGPCADLVQTAKHVRSKVGKSAKLDRLEQLEQPSSEELTFMQKIKKWGLGYVLKFFAYRAYKPILQCDAYGVSVTGLFWAGRISNEEKKTGGFEIGCTAFPVNFGFGVAHPKLHHSLTELENKLTGSKLGRWTKKRAQDVKLARDQLVEGLKDGTLLPQHSALY